MPSRVRLPVAGCGDRSLRLYWLALLAITTAACGGAGEEPLVLDGVTVVDVTGAPPLVGGRIVIRGTRIAAVGPIDSVALPRGARRLDLTGRWVIPGLIDAHVHADPWTLSRFLAWGVTAIRDLHNDSAVATRLQEVGALGGVPAPRVLAAGRMIDGAPRTYPDAVEVVDPVGARRAVDTHLLAGRSWIKVYSHVNRDLLAAIVDESNSLGLPVAAHLGLVDAVVAARLGVRTIEHLTGVVEASVEYPAPLYHAHGRFFEGWNSVERAWSTLPDESLERTARALAATGVVLVPTLIVHETFAAFSDTAALAALLPLDDVPDSVRATWDLPGLIQRAGWTPADYAAFRRSRPKQDLFVRRFRAAGGMVLAGSDAVNQMLVPGAALHQELELLVAAGLTPAEALRAATWDAARALGADSLGRVARGSLADLVVLDADPQADIRNTRRIALVVVRGWPTDPRDLRRSW